MNIFFFFNEIISSSRHIIITIVVGFNEFALPNVLFMATVETREFKIMTKEKSRQKPFECGVELLKCLMLMILCPDNSASPLYYYVDRELVRYA